jgi:hypothetical protein
MGPVGPGASWRDLCRPRFNQRCFSEPKGLISSAMGNGLAKKRARADRVAGSPESARRGKDPPPGVPCDSFRTARGGDAHSIVNSPSIDGDRF